ncbi:uncharacterized protein LOC143243146 [Tachypleus tridentatus]|uniref:uncharacterized protein LOC143243146 n=1 Tax=Tachypleus tridentatus TaxID=6853 RepID=UPI003FD242F7
MHPIKSSFPDVTGDVLSNVKRKLGLLEVSKMPQFSKHFQFGKCEVLNLIGKHREQILGGSQVRISQSNKMSNPTSDGRRGKIPNRGRFPSNKESVTGTVEESYLGSIT